MKIYLNRERRLHTFRPKEVLPLKEALADALKGSSLRISNQSAKGIPKPEQARRKQDLLFLSRRDDWRLSFPFLSSLDVGHLLGRLKERISPLSLRGYQYQVFYQGQRQC